jgi:hypothetical protein
MFIAIHSLHAILDSICNIKSIISQYYYSAIANFSILDIYFVEKDIYFVKNLYILHKSGTNSREYCC